MCIDVVISVMMSILCYYRQNKRYIVLHSVSLLDYFPYGAGGVQYLSESNVIVIAGWSDAKGMGNNELTVNYWYTLHDSTSSTFIYQ